MKKKETDVSRPIRSREEVIQGLFKPKTPVLGLICREKFCRCQKQQSTRSEHQQTQIR